MNFTACKVVKNFTFAVTLGLIFSPTLIEAYPHPEQKISIVGGGILGALHAYYAHINAQQQGKHVRVTIYEKNPSLVDTTTSRIVPSLTPDEILSVVPRGKQLVEKLQIPFNQPGGIRVDDVANVNRSTVATRFMEQAELYSQDINGYQQRTQALLELGKMSMDLWQKIYDEATPEVKAILIASNFNPCREPRNTDAMALHDGYRIDLIYNIPNAGERARGMKRDYEDIGYKNCKLLSPTEVSVLDPFLADFCKQHSTINQAGDFVWNNDCVALWRPGGCLDTQTFLPKIYAYLEKAMGSYRNALGKTKNYFRLKFNREVTGVTYSENQDSLQISGVQFADGRKNKAGEYVYPHTRYIFCPGEAVGTLDRLGFKEPAYAGFAGATLMINIPIPADKVAEYSKFNHCMEVHQEGVVLAWQARFRDGKIFIGLGGTKAFYGDKRPNKDEAFACDRNLLQLNMANDVLPEFISLALGRNTTGQQLTHADMKFLEDNNIAQRWAGTRAVVFDGFPTMGIAYRADGKAIENALINTHAGSGGVSFGPAVVACTLAQATRSFGNPVVNRALSFAQSDRIANE